MTGNSDDSVVLGRFTGHHGVRGWVRVDSWTRPPEQIFEYTEVLVGENRRSVTIKAGKRSGKSLVASIEGFENREQSESLLGEEIAIPRESLGDPGEGEYYWFDLLGLLVVNAQDICLGKIKNMMETGANDVMVVEPVDFGPAGTTASGDRRERLLPWIDQVVESVDLESGVIRVDWPEDY